MVRRIVMLLVLLTFAGPAFSNSLVGEWNCGLPGDLSDIEIGIAYDQNGGFEKYVLLSGDLDAQEIDTQLSLLGRWTMSGQTLHEQVTSIEVLSLYIDGKDALRTPSAKPILDEIASLVGQQALPARISFVTRDHFLSKNDWDTTDCTRVEIVDD